MPPLLETTSSSEGVTITPQQIVDMPLNGRNYLDLMQLVPAWPSPAKPISIATTPRPFLASVPTTLASSSMVCLTRTNSMAVLRAIQSGHHRRIPSHHHCYKAEFGHASGGVVNVITKSGSNEFMAWFRLPSKQRVRQFRHFGNSVPSSCADYDLAGVRHGS